MQVAFKDIKYQSLSFMKEKTVLFSLENLEVIDKLAEKQRFAKTFMKKDSGDIPSPGKKQALSMTRSYEKPEAEEEASVNKNNGLPLIRIFE